MSFGLGVALFLDLLLIEATWGVYEERRGYKSRATVMREEEWLPVYEKKRGYKGRKEVIREEKRLYEKKRGYKRRRAVIRRDT